MKLLYQQNILLTPTTPFHFDATFHKPDHFTSGDNQWESGIRWQTWQWQGECLGLKFLNSGTVDRPKIRLRIFSTSTLTKSFLDSLVPEVRYRYNLDLDLAPFYTQGSRDDVLGPVITKWRGMRPGHPSSLYEYLTIGIVLQNATVRRSIQMFQALLSRYGTPLAFDGKNLWCFWEPGRLKSVREEELRSLKVGYRARSIKKIDEAFVGRTIDEMRLRQQSLKVQQAELLKLYGVGPATVWYLLFDVFHHWDHFTHISPWEQKIYSKIFFNRDPEHPVPVEKLLRHFKRYHPYEQLAVHYLWEDLWWKRTHEHIPWLKKLIRT